MNMSIVCWILFFVALFMILLIVFCALKFSKNQPEDKPTEEKPKENKCCGCGNSMVNIETMDAQPSDCEECYRCMSYG